MVPPASLTPDDPRPYRHLRAHRQRVDQGSKYVGLGGIIVWRTIKAVSQLAVIAMAMWGGVQGAVTYEFALGVALIAYLGAESVEEILAAVGTKTSQIEREPQDDTDETE